jgi:hypothetical protein
LGLGIFEEMLESHLGLGGFFGELNVIFLIILYYNNYMEL